MKIIILILGSQKPSYNFSIMLVQKKGEIDIGGQLTDSDTAPKHR